MNATDFDEVARYAAAVRAHLAAQPGGLPDDLVEDLEDHLREVAAETDGPLVDRLGSPRDYAEELRASAGMAPSRRRRRWPGWLAPERVRHAVDALWLHRATRAVVAFLPELRPAWWIVRAYIAVQLVAWATYGPITSIVPRPFGNGFLGLTGLAVAIWLSVRLAKRPTPTERTGRALLLANTFLAFASVAVVLEMAGDNTVTYYYSDQGPQYYYPVSGDGSGLHLDGLPVLNIYPIARDGTLLTDVYLYDQDGRPLDPAEWFIEDDPAHQDTPAGPFPRDYIDEEGNEVDYRERLREVLPPFVDVPTEPPTSGASESPAPNESPALSESPGK